MANVSIKFNGKEFLLSCEDGQEEHLEELLNQINLDIRKELHEKLDEFATHNDSLEEIFENKEINPERKNHDQ